MDCIYSLQPQAVATVHAETKQSILEQLAHRFAVVYGLDEAEVLDRIQDREKLGSTGFGRGVAIPHARIDGVRSPVVAVLRLEEPVEFDAADGMPVDLVFGLISPDNAGARHLQALASISRIARNEAIREMLADAKDADAIFALINNVTDRDAA